jgi:hypothetical protein
MKREIDAATQANDLIKLILQHQPGLFGSAPVSNSDRAQETARALAAFRAELIEQLKQQPRNLLQMQQQQRRQQLQQQTPHSQQRVLL